jgi:hypothetical protein
MLDDPFWMPILLKVSSILLSTDDAINSPPACFSRFSDSNLHEAPLYFQVPTSCSCEIWLFWPRIEPSTAPRIPPAVEVCVLLVLLVTVFVVPTPGIPQLLIRAESARNEKTCKKFNFIIKSFKSPIFSLRISS